MSEKPTLAEIVEKHFRENDPIEGVRAFNALLKLVQERRLFQTVEAMSARRGRKST